MKYSNRIDNGRTVLFHEDDNKYSETVIYVENSADVFLYCIADKGSPLAGIVEVSSIPQTLSVTM